MRRNSQCNWKYTAAAHTVLVGRAGCGVIYRGLPGSQRSSQKRIMSCQTPRSRSGDVLLNIQPPISDRRARASRGRESKGILDPGRRFPTPLCRIRVHHSGSILTFGTCNCATLGRLGIGVYWRVYFGSLGTTSHPSGCLDFWSRWETCWESHRNRRIHSIWECLYTRLIINCRRRTPYARTGETSTACDASLFPCGHTGADQGREGLQLALIIIFSTSTSSSETTCFAHHTRARRSIGRKGVQRN
ncbi:hypothetical protein C8R46DRAFT_561863 [Mycena filopes]|nr:hypothetical protein C8R46DRAFT_561863 [Mycena filopes]